VIAIGSSRFSRKIYALKPALALTFNQVTEAAAGAMEPATGKVNRLAAGR
jgi:hypothetical protein